jgi:hypothetical protein
VASAATRSRALDPVALGLEVSPAGVASLVACGWRADGRIHGEVIAVRPGTGWVLDVLLRRRRAVDPAVLVIDKAGPAGSLLPAHRERRPGAAVLTARQRAQADTGLVDDLETGPAPRCRCRRWTPRRGGDVAGDRHAAKAFDRRDGGPTSPRLVGLSLARFGLLTTPNRRRAAAAMPEPIRPRPKSATAAASST